MSDFVDWTLDLDESELAAWRGRYSSVFVTAKRHEELTKAGTKAGYANQAPFIATVAEMQRFQYNPKFVKKLYNITYRWACEMKAIMEEDENPKRHQLLVPSRITSSFPGMASPHLSAVMEIGEFQLNPDGDEMNGYLSYLRGHGESFKSWVSIKQSVVKEDSLGLFAARQFPRYSIIGFVVGNVVYRSEHPGKALDKSVKYDGRTEEDFVMMRDFEGHQVAIRCPTRAKWNEARPLFFGLHYMIDQTALRKSEMVTQSSSKNVTNNCVVLADGCVVTLRRVVSGEELLGFRDCRMAPLVLKKPSPDISEDEEDGDNKGSKKRKAKKSVVTRSGKFAMESSDSDEIFSEEEDPPLKPAAYKKVPKSAKKGGTS